MPIVEFTSFPASDSFSANPTLIEAPVTNIIANAPGFISAHFGLQVEDKKTGYLAIVWETLEAHKKLAATAGYAELGAQLKPLLAGPIQVQHIEFSGDAIPALEAPATELATAVMKEGKSKEDLVSFIQVMLEGSKDIPGTRSNGVFGEITEEPKTFNLLLGWESVEAHAAVVSAAGPAPEVLKKFVELVDITVVHVKFTNIA